MPLDWDVTTFTDKLTGTRGCMLCKDLGWHKITGVSQWCTCEAAQARRVAEPALLEQMQQEQDQFNFKFGGGSNDQ